MVPELSQRTQSQIHPNLSLTKNKPRENPSRIILFDTLMRGKNFYIYSNIVGGFNDLEYCRNTR